MYDTCPKTAFYFKNIAGDQIEEDDMGLSLRPVLANITVTKLVVVS